jgi:hypothetical protein
MRPFEIPEIHQAIAAADAAGAIQEGVFRANELLHIKRDPPENLSEWTHVFRKQVAFSFTSHVPANLYLDPSRRIVLAVVEWRNPKCVDITGTVRAFRQRW